MSAIQFWIIMVLWALAVLAVIIYLYRRVRKEEEPELDHDALFDAVCEELAREWETKRRLSRDAAEPITENEWQSNARKAEGLGFRDEIEPKRAS